MRVLFLITARAGSKGVPRKNLRQLAGISLVGYKAISARQSKYCTRLIISTESPEIQDDARQYGVDVPFTRPVELATDGASTDDVVRHALEWIERETEERYDAIMILQPSTPFTRPSDYDAAVELMVARKANVVLGMRTAPVHSTFVGPLEAEGRLTTIVDKVQALQSIRRQDMMDEYTMNGALFLTRWDYFKTHGRIYCDPSNTYGYVMPTEYSLEIDESLDWALAQTAVDYGYVDLTPWR